MKRNLKIYGNTKFACFQLNSILTVIYVSVKAYFYYKSHHLCNQCLSPLKLWVHGHGEVHSIQHYVIKFISDLWQVSGFLQVRWFPPPIKLTANDITVILLKVTLNTINHKPHLLAFDQNWVLIITWPLSSHWINIPFGAKSYPTMTTTAPALHSGLTI